MFLFPFITTMRSLRLQLIFGRLFFPAKKSEFVFSCQFLPPNTLTVKPSRAHVLQRRAHEGTQWGTFLGFFVTQYLLGLCAGEEIGGETRDLDMLGM